ncbi:endo alpha-1,4 polygalactosaminidase [Branchiibius sp. NY16-3462-2]|uniref:endo alpha-1,4 polygalactosaminidase n=1 Tax=Branchiibius sp. NY16-3462-2 TaxID=1807500 RepID=UPI0025BC9DD4|nr:endo alpha-1,4 polygalactosaminidase [Branchiibius sp. NY16-3462-2]
MKRAAVALLAVASLAACGRATPAPQPPAHSPTHHSATQTHSAIHLPPAGVGFDYQLGGPYAPPKGVRIVERDRTAQPAAGVYNICYVNGFQTQPEESRSFAAQHPDLVLQTPKGPLVDPGWPDEYLFDTSTPAKRSALTTIVGGWIAGCGRDGFSAVEVDNLDSFTRSKGALTADDNLALAGAYAKAAHAAGLGIAQKNTAEYSAKVHALGYDFAITESCYQFSECASYTKTYPVVLDVEYGDELGEDGFQRACADANRPRAMILRDHDLSVPGDADYLYRTCP